MPSILTPRKAINKAFLKIRPVRSEIELFKSEFKKLLKSVEHKNFEEHHKNSISDFLKNTYYSSKKKYINISDRIDLVIHNGEDQTSSVGVIIEAKRPSNQNEMPTINTLNKKALQELVLYFLRERISNKNLEIKHLIVTNLEEWFIFDGAIFDKHFAQDKKLVKKFNDFEQGNLSIKTTDKFYEEIAKPKINEIASEIEFVHFKLEDYENELNDNDNSNDNKLIPIFKLLSPEHLLKLPFQNDSNTLDNRFYSELLHIIGLVESRSGNKKLIGRNEVDKRNRGTLIENAIRQLDSMDKIYKVKDIESYGIEKDERLYNIALELVITWVNRVLFLKLLESQLISYHNGDTNYAFLNYNNISCYDDLNELFFQVLAKPTKEREKEISAKYGIIPYLNSSLFEPSDLEQVAFAISGLNTNINIPVFSNTVLKSEKGKKLTGELNSLEYLFKFLDAYDFTSEGSEEIQEENKTLINAAVLGLIFEKINGYKDGSYFTPGFITMHMCRQAISKAVIQKFNEIKGWNCNDLTEIYNSIDDISEANNIINDIKICDPAVGSGHFLVSSLNEIIAIKSELKILQDLNGKRLKEYQVEVENDELVVTDENGALFRYNPNNLESQRIQETLFREKQTIIENCLFGVDINANSVKICRLRLWIELLKHAYYKNKHELETLPNIDINIKCGNSLISKFEIDADLKQTLKTNNLTIHSYKNAVNGYKNANDKAQKREMEKLIETIKSNITQGISASSPEFIKLTTLKVAKLQLDTPSLIPLTKKEIEEKDKKLSKLNKNIAKYNGIVEDLKTNRIYKNSFEWRFEFPEVLDDEGNFMGFDVILGNPPYVSIEAYSGTSLQSAWKSKYKVFASRGDIYCLFFELGFRVLRKYGNLCYITSNKYFRSGYGKALREFMVKYVTPLQIIDFGELPVFEVGTDTSIMLAQNIIPPEEATTKVATVSDKHKIQDVSQEFKSRAKLLGLKELSPEGWSFTDGSVRLLLDKMKNKGIPLNKYVNGGLSYGIKTGYNEAFIITEETKNHLIEADINSKHLIKPWLRGTDIKRWYADLQPLFVIVIRNGFNTELHKFPAILKHLQSYESKLRQRGQCEGKNDKPGTQQHHWLELDNSPSQIYFEQMEKPKIIYNETSKNLHAFVDKEGLYVNKTGFTIVHDELEYILGVINSKLFDFFYRHEFPSWGDPWAGGRIQFRGDRMAKLPIIQPNLEQKNAIADIVNEIHCVKKKEHCTNVSILEKRIDQLVYQLYGLTKEEIAIVEEA